MNNDLIVLKELLEEFLDSIPIEAKRKSFEDYKNTISYARSPVSYDSYIVSILKYKVLNTLLDSSFSFLKDSMLTLQEVADICDITRERVRQIENVAISKLKHPKVIERKSKIELLAVMHGLHSDKHIFDEPILVEGY